MLDLGASINVMATSIFNSLGLGPLKAIGMVIHLANRSNTHPAGLVGDVLDRVNELIFLPTFTFWVTLLLASPPSFLQVIP